MSQYLNLQDRLYQGVGQFDIPEIRPVYELSVKEWIGFNYANSFNEKKKQDTGVNFFLDDYQFERLWNAPNKYIRSLSKFNALASPDFSLYSDFPKAVQIFNHYRKHWLARYWQDMGMTVIPTISWSDEESFDWCFDGEPVGGIVMVSNCGCMKRQDTKEGFLKGYTEMLNRLQPKQVLFFAHTFDEYPGPVKYIRFSLGREERMPAQWVDEQAAVAAV